jgi:anti-sigma regulatory factor (Ser/Thr protein kinase)
VRVPSDDVGPGLARRYARVLLAGRVSDEAVERIELVVSELVTNAYLHGSPPIDVTLEVHHGVVRVDVTDGSPDTSPHSPTDTEVGGRGLKIMRAVSAHHGVDVANGHKSVWCEVPAD